MSYRPRKLPPDIPLDEAEEEVLFTRAAAAADPNAVDLLGETNDWLPLVEATRTSERDARAASMNADALRSIANLHFDRACINFADELWLAIGKDRENPRWKRFFAISPSRFVRRSLAKQMQDVQAWLEGPTDPVLDKHRANLSKWLSAAQEAVKMQAAAAGKRGAAAQTRAEMASDLTKERDGFFELLSARGRERDLPRDWPRTFFRVILSAASKADEADKPEPNKGDT